VVLVVQEVQEVLEEVITINLGLYQVLVDLVVDLVVVVVQETVLLAKLVDLVVIGQTQEQILTTAEMVAVEVEQSLGLIIASQV